jgi:hypothetical protein
MGCNCNECRYSALICLKDATKNPKKKFVNEHETCAESETMNKWKDELVKKDV